MNTIGRKPVRYYSTKQLQEMAAYDLLIIVAENAWEEIIGTGKTIEDWKKLELGMIRTLVRTKMNEWKQQAERKA